MSTPLLFRLFSLLLSAAVLAQDPAAPPPVDTLAIWKDPTFQRRLQESYLAETDIEPRLDDDEREQMQGVYLALGEGQCERAQQLLQSLCVGRYNAVYDYTLANLHFEAERLDEAAQGYLAATEKFPRFRRAWKNLGLIHVRRSAWQLAATALTRVIELGGHDATTWGLLGHCHASLENPLAAESAFRMANLLAPGTLDWQTGLCRAFFKQRRFADAAAMTGVLLAAYPDRADLWLLQANAYLGLEQPQKAAENFELVDRLGAATPDSLNLLGDIYCNQQRFELAVSAYGKALAKSPDVKVDRALRGAKALFAQQAHGPAKTLLATVQKERGGKLADHERKDLLKLQARLAVAEGAGDDEAKILAEVVALDPLDGEALILLGQHAARHGQAEQAVFHYERAAALEKHEAEAKLRHGQLLVGQGKYQEALPLLRRAQQLQPRESLQQYLEQVEKVAAGR